MRRSLGLLFPVVIASLLACGGGVDLSDVVVRGDDGGSATVEMVDGRATVRATGEDGSVAVVTQQADGSMSVSASGDAGTVHVASGVTTAAGPAKTGAATATGDLPGTWLGVCQGMETCGCMPTRSATSCARTLETTYAEGIAMAAAMGTPAEMLAMMDMTEDRLFMAANSTCATLCSQMTQFGGPGGGGAASGSVGGGGAHSGVHVQADGVDVRIDAHAGPGGAEIHIEDLDMGDDW